MRDPTYVPVRAYVATLWPATLFELPDLALFDDVWIEPLVVETEPDITVATALLFETSLELGIPGLDAVRLVIAPSGSATSFMLRFASAPVPAISLVNVPLALRFRGDLLRPVRKAAPDAQGVEAWEVDPTREFIDLQIATATITVDFDGNIAVDVGPGLNLPPAMIGDSGVVVEASEIGIFLDATRPPPGKPAGWRGVHIAHAAVHLPAGLSETVGTLSMDDAFIGNGGFSGEVALDWTPALAGTLLGMDVTLKHAGITLRQNTLTAGEIAGTMQLPFFDAPVGIAVGIGLDGSFDVALSGGSNGLVTVAKPGVLELTLESLGFAVEAGRPVARLSGSLRPLVGGLDWPSFEVRELSIDADGNVKLEGGWLNLREGYRLDLSGFQFEITKMGFGSTEDGGKWLGFSGGLKLVEGMPAGASVEGLRVIWYDDGRPPTMTLNGVGVEFEVPAVLRFKGAVSYRELPGGVRRFDGSIKLELTTLGLEIDGQLVLGSAPGYTFMAIYLGAELPAGIPLWTTGLGLYGLAGIFAGNMEPDKQADEPWYGIGPGEGWYKRPQIGVTDLVKWRNQQGSIALGGGVTIGTVADNGFTFAGRFLLAIVFPGPILLIEGKGNILKERSSLSEDPLFRALAVIDGREGTFLIGLDVLYKYALTGEVIEIGGSAEALFDFDDPMGWHFYLGMRDPRERRIRAEVFRLFEANAYLMLDPHQLAMGAFVGYDRSWKFGPVRARLEAWIEGHAIVSFKPVQFHGELWLHGRAELKVFGFGFDIGADARVTADVFEPFGIRIELEVHLGLPWPLPDFDVDMTLQWGPEPTAPPLPLPLKDVAIEHFKVTTSWPLPRSPAPALLAPNHDADNDGFLGAPDVPVATLEAAPPPASAPVVPLDARPHVTFARNVHDDALIGVNAQPPFPAAQPDPGWEWIGDPVKNEGPVRIRSGLKEVALERWTAAGSWTAVARKGPGPNPAGVPTLYGSWAPVQQLPGGTSAPGTAPAPGNTKLWLWSRSGFDYVRHSTGQWAEWWSDLYPDYPCIPVPPDEEICCDFRGLQPGDMPASPWRCPRHPDFAVGWYYPATPAVTDGGDGPALCFEANDRMELRLGRSVQRVRLFLSTGRRDEGGKGCLDFRNRSRGMLPNPVREAGYRFTIRDGRGAPAAQARIDARSINGATISGLDTGFALLAELPAPAQAVHLLLTPGAGPPVRLLALAADGRVLDERGIEGGQLVQVSLFGDAIAAVEIDAEMDETVLHQICGEWQHGGLEIVGVTRAGAETGPAALTGGVAELPGRDLVSVRVRGGGQRFCLRGFCVDLGLSRSDRNRLEVMNQHLQEETARWSAEGHVLQPHASYRLRIVTTVETRDFPHDPAFNTTRELIEFAYFRTAGPPGLTVLSRPAATQAPSEFESGLDDLARYVDQTVPPTVPPPGQPPSLPRPVFRGYDVGVQFNEDYVDLLYRISGRDLGLYLYDANNQPARDVFGRLLLSPNRWGRAETLTLTATDKTWIDLVNASSCATIDSDLIVRPRTLGLDGQVLAADTLYEARLVPLLLHETFAGHPPGTAAVGNGATLAAPGGGWVVADMGGNGGPSRWVVHEGGTPVTRWIEQESNIWGGPDLAADPTNPGTVLLRAGDPALPASHPDQPANWTDYRLTAILRAMDDDAIGLVLRHRGPGDHYLFAMDRERRYRRLVKVAGGSYTILAADSFAYGLDSDMIVSIEAIGDRLTVYQDGARIFDVTDGTHPAGGIGLYCWAVEGARFADIRVDDFRATAPVVHRFQFTTSRFANFAHQVGAFPGETWRAALPGPSVVAAAAAAAAPLAGLPAAPAEAESRAHDALAAALLGPAARKDTAYPEATAFAVGGTTAGILLRMAEPIDWSRTELSLLRAAGAGPAFGPAAGAVPGNGPLRIAGWSAASAPGAGDESVTLLLDEALSPDGWRLDYRTLASALPAEPEGSTLAEDPFLRIGESSVTEGPVLFAPALDDLAGFTVHDPAAIFSPPSAWAASGGVVIQTALTGSPFGGTVAQAGTHLVSDETAWRDVAIAATLRTDMATGAVGIVFRYRDEANYYRFSMSPTGPFRHLVCCKGGVFTLLWQDSEPVATGQDYALAITALGGAISVAIDGTPVCTVRDANHASGGVGFYSWRCRSGSFSQLSVTALSRDLPGWTFTEMGALSADPVWQREGAALSQTAILSATPATADPAMQGAYAIADGGPWTDIRLRLRLSMEAPDAAGVALRWRGPEDHLLLVLDGRSGSYRVIERAGGVSTDLASGPASLAPGAWAELEIEVIGTRLRVELDGALLCDLHRAGHPEGGVALFVCTTGSTQFAGFRVEAAAPVWRPYATLAGIDRLAAGRRLRLFAGRESDVALPPVTSEIRRYQNLPPGDPKRRRLPAEGMDLRLTAPDGTIRGLRRFAPDAAFTAVPARALRSADGTGLAVLVPDAGAATLSRLEPGIYRLRWRFRRDNSGAVPGSLVLREQGDTAAEDAFMDVEVP